MFVKRYFRSAFVLTNTYRPNPSSLLYKPPSISCHLFGKKTVTGHTFSGVTIQTVKYSTMSGSDKESEKRKSESSAESDNGEPAAKKPCTEHQSFGEKIKAMRTGVCKSVAEFKFNKKRVRVLSKALDCPDDSNGILYWMSRDQRVQDNWAFLYAQKLALKMEVPLHVCFCLVPKFLDATIRHYTFLLEGLKEVEKECRDLDISFHLLTGHAKDVLPSFIEKHKIGGVVCDFSPLRVPAGWVKDVSKAIPKDVAFCQVDAHNIVPCWEASPKLEYGARTIRSKIHKQLSQYLTEFPPVCKHKYKAKSSKDVDWEAAYKSLEVDQSIPPVDWATPGTQGAYKTLESFCKERLKYFNADRNNPNKNALSNLSPWIHFEVDQSIPPVDWATPGTQGAYKTLESFCKERLKYFNADRNNPNKNALSNLLPWIHFGQISVQRCIIVVKQYRSKSSESVEAFIEESIIRRELADNFCYYNENYDKIEGAYDWAKETLKAHEKDKRSHIYSREQLEKGQTHDRLWNAAQNQMANEGKMHGFMRMYWAKKILEWTPSPKDALEIAIYLNDKYSLDGRDPNGYVGCMWSICGIHDQGWKEREVFGKIHYMNYKGCCMWSICGIHDQGWKEREVFGKIRYMNYKGCERKFNVSSFEMKHKRQNIIK